jgi:hypothetical protein
MRVADMVREICTAAHGLFAVPTVLPPPTCLAAALFPQSDRDGDGHVTATWLISPVTLAGKLDEPVWRTSPVAEVNDLGFQLRVDARSHSSALPFRNPCHPLVGKRARFPAEADRVAGSAAEEQGSGGYVPLRRRLHQKGRHQ